MNIGIDARLIGETGVGRYTRNLLQELAKIDTKNRYTIYLPHAAYEKFKLPNSRWRKRLALVAWHTFQEQLVMPVLFYQDRLDLLHVPYFNVPLFYFGKVVVTMHDLTIYHELTGKASRLPYFLYLIKHLAYRVLLYFGLNRAAIIIAVSEATKDDLKETLGISENKIQVTYEGVDELLLERGIKPGLPVPSKYFLYVGNVYPHKNIGLLLTAYDSLYERLSGKMPYLVFVGREDYFLRKLQAETKKKSWSRRVVYLKEIADNELVWLYDHALALVLPSKREGFGLPALEAAARGCPVVTTDLPVFREILGDHAKYFRSESSEGLEQELAKVAAEESGDRPRSGKLVSLFAKKFTWALMAKKTLAAYEGSDSL